MTKKRVALGAILHRAHQRFGRPGPHGGGDEAGDLGLAEAPERDPLHHRLAGQRAEGLGQRLAGGNLHIAVGAKHGHTSVPELGGQEL